MADTEKGFYSIQLGSFSDRHNAADMVNKLKRLGHNAFYRAESIKRKGTFYRVYIERYRSREEAEKEAKVLRKLDLISNHLIKHLDKTTPESAPKTARATGAYFLHVASFKNKSNAEKKVEKLGKNGHKAFFVLEEISGESFFRIYIGQFNDENGARKVGAKLKKKGLISYFKSIKIDKNMIHDKGTE